MTTMMMKKKKKKKNNFFVSYKIYIFLVLLCRFLVFAMGRNTYTTAVFLTGMFQGSFSDEVAIEIEAAFFTPVMMKHVVEYWTGFLVIGMLFLFVIWKLTSDDSFIANLFEVIVASSANMVYSRTTKKYLDHWPQKAHLCLNVILLSCLFLLWGVFKKYQKENLIYHRIEMQRLE